MHKRAKRGVQDAPPKESNTDAAPVGTQMRVGPAWLEMTKRIADSGWTALSDQRAAELFAYIAGSHGDRIAADIRDITVMEGLFGDQGMMQNLLNAVLNKLPENKPLTAAETYGLCIALARVVRSPQGIQLASGADKRRGGTRQGAKSVLVALDVIRELTHGKARSFEEAWAAVAAERHLSESAVKKCWMERRALLLATLRTPLDVTAAQLVSENVAAGNRKP